MLETELVAHTRSRLGRSRKTGISLSSSLVTPCAGEIVPMARAGDLLDLVDEDDDVVEPT